MIISLSPQLRPDTLELSRAGDSLTLNGESFDFTDLAEGEARSLDCPWIIGPVRREAGVLHLVVLLPHDADAPEETRFPAPVEVAADGPVTLPPRTAPAQEPAPPEADA